ncbi:long-chain fatty acid--CoA ligase [Peribacillus butanolivorans]|uniref:Long-chain fatty acid--CoA ligase n=1 Tax=Peribacillus butanolivorans TaxID=421767 RepID=A0AAX0S915_9BACI|nr:long-chain fatty acid--CoA ligase [Peribacillus butanolivorans]PEJ37139.1 long-chain fatty acid--CoA ligase [Peribacillus butanolivorans]
MRELIRTWHEFYPKEAPLEIEIPLLSLYDLLEHSAQLYPTNKAVIDGEKELTYLELKNASDCFAADLYNRGFQKNNRIALMLPNCLEYIIAYYAIHRLGGVVVQVNPLYQPNELDYILRDSEATWFIGHDKQKKKLEQIGLTDEFTIISANNMLENSVYSWSVAGNKDLPEMDINPKEDLAVLQYTGGTTGKSKGVMLTHFNLISNVHQDFTFTANALQLKIPGERMLGLIPLFHVFGNGRLNSSVYAGSTYITLEKFELNKVVDLIRKHRPTIFPGVPTMYIALLNHPDLTADDLSCFKYCSCGSAPLPIEVINQFEEKLGISISEGFGMSETSPTTHRNPVIGQRKPGSIGIPYPNTDAKIVDIETGIHELPTGQAGELIIKGPQVTKGYWKNLEETATALRDGWLYTGDIARMDEEGYFYIVGRKKDMIIASGYNIYPIEVEDIIYQHPSVEEACVFGIPDKYRGETVKAAIVLKKGMCVTEQEIMDFCYKRLARYKVPRRFEFREQLPKSTVGKILRRILLEEEMEKQTTITKGER